MYVDQLIKAVVDAAKEEIVRKNVLLDLKTFTGKLKQN
jgi:hypothetical protein